MQKLIQGQRQISLGVLLGLIAVVAVGAALLLFILTLYSTAHSAKDAEDDLRSTIQARCQARVAYDTRFVQASKDDVVFYDRILRLTKLTDKSKMTPVQLKVSEEYTEAITQARDRKQAIVAQGVIANCGVYNRK